MVETSLKYKKRNREVDCNAPVREEFEWFPMQDPEEMRKPIGRVNLSFNNILQILMLSLNSHQAFVNNPTIDEYDGILGLEEFKTFITILCLYEWRLNYCTMDLFQGLAKTAKLIFKNNEI